MAAPQVERGAAIYFTELVSNQILCYNTRMLKRAYMIKMAADDWTKGLPAWAAPVAGGLLGAGLGAITPGFESEDAVYDEKGRKIGVTKKKNRLLKALIGGALGAGAGIGYNSIGGDSLGEKWNKVKGLFGGGAADEEPPAEAVAEAAPEASIFPTTDKFGRPIDPNLKLNWDVYGANVDGEGALTEEKLKRYNDSDYYNARLGEAIANVSMNPDLVKDYRENALADYKNRYGVNDLDPRGQTLVELRSAMDFAKDKFAKEYQNKLEQAYGLESGALDGRMLDIGGDLQRRFKERLDAEGANLPEDDVNNTMDYLFDRKKQQ